MRFPQHTYGGLKNLVGTLYDDPLVEEYRSTFPNTLIKSQRGTCAFKHDLESEYEVEELVAYLLAHARQQAESYGNDKVSGAVITVPPSFNHFDRQAILDAAEIVSLKVYALIHDATAVAINFALGKKFPKKEYHIFYDMGAGTTTASVISFHSGTDPKTGLKNLIDIEVKGHSTISNLGGHQVDLRLQNYLAQQFTEKYKSQLKGDIFKDPRAMARLLKEANRCKTILSANQNVVASIEGLMEDFDFKQSVSRETLEELCQDLFSKVTIPVTDVLVSSNISLDEIKSLVLVGGGIRIPAVQTALQKVVGESKIARNVDGDEAAVLGAVLHAASVSAQFRLGFATRIRDLNPNPINIAYTPENNSQVLDTLIFPPKSFLGSKKLMTFKRISDFSFDIDYKSETLNTPIAHVKVSGLSDAVEKFKHLVKEDPKVKIQIQLTDSGLLQVKEGHAIFEIPPALKSEKEEKGDSIADTVMGFFGKKKEESTPEADSSDTAEKVEESPKVEENAKEKAKREAKEKKEAETANKVLIEKIPLNFEIEWLTVPPLDSGTLSELKSRVQQMDAADIARFKREESLNGLETYIYKCKELTWDDDFDDISTSQEQDDFKDKLSEVGDWFEDNSENASTADFVSRKNELFAIAKVIFKRRREISERPVIIDTVQEELRGASKIVELLTERLDETTITVEELENLKSFLESESKWLQENVEAQKALANNQVPILTVKDLNDHLASIRFSLTKMDPTKRMKPKKPVASENNDTTTGQNPEQFRKMMTELLEKSNIKLDKKVEDMTKEELDEAIANWLKQTSNEPPEQSTEGEDKSEDDTGNSKTGETDDAKPEDNNVGHEGGEL